MSVDFSAILAIISLSGSDTEIPTTVIFGFNFLAQTLEIEDLAQKYPLTAALAFSLHSLHGNFITSPPFLVFLQMSTGMDFRVTCTLFFAESDIA